MSKFIKMLGAQLRLHPAKWAGIGVAVVFLYTTFLPVFAVLIHLASGLILANRRQNGPIVTSLLAGALLLAVMGPVAWVNRPAQAEPHFMLIMRPAYFIPSGP